MLKDVLNDLLRLTFRFRKAIVALQARREVQCIKSYLARGRIFSTIWKMELEGSFGIAGQAQ